MSDILRGADVVVAALRARPNLVKDLYVAHIGTLRAVFVLRELRNSYARNQQMNLFGILESFSMIRATPAHDQIYALLGFCSSEEAAQNPIRYDLEPEVIYGNGAVAHVQLYDDLDFLGLCTPDQRVSILAGPLQDRKI